MIKVHKISKSYNNIQALNEVSLEISKGEIFGLLGPNGAGKTTTINILNTLLKPDDGKVIVDGINLSENPQKVKMLIGVVPQEIALYRNMTAYENLIFWGGLYNIPAQALKTNAEQVLKMVGLWDRKNDRIDKYSGGMKRRINIASSILHDPKIILMDEPAVGVDPQSRNHIFEVISNLNKEGKTIIYTTHYMEEAERLCNTIAIIDSGKIMAKGTLQELKDFSKVKDLLIIEASNLDEEKIINLSKQLEIKVDDSLQFISVECSNIGKEIFSVINEINKTGIEIKRIDSKIANLESVFLKLTGKQLRD
ncbi:MAG: ABC transporter ATP-binding protein [Prolixibacteraceae bacterium]|nr:ABC transporter ATP-binding protein [Prolixibacteraceae bacterium]